ncbi:hypothetical protein NVP1233A_16 [Vibrio phage 1.233.A._10N.261.51.E6]|nr:hypothetical protein NVP1233A_16 [Vibrio phage 1.233.A._10N.261.51.E6]AUR96889.1 hypothetical protein NVP1233B_16 [Vibrio phage 1.233.B._10N.261.51.E6]
MRGVLHDELEYPDLPRIFSPILESYKDLSSSDITYQEVSSYTSMTGIELDGFDIGLIKDLDYIKKMISSGKTPKDVLEAFGYGKA